MFISNFCYSQQKDTIYTIDNSIESIVKANARDSIFHDHKNKQVHLYGEASLFYEEISLKADYMLIDFNKNEVYASYTYGKDSVRVGMPKFTDGTEEIDAAKIRYNFDTKKGFIQEVKLKQDENFLYMEVAKRHPNEEVHFRKGRFTTCDLDEPHFHFQLSKAILIPEKRIVSGPMNLWVNGVPTPLGLPFMFIPQKKEKDHNHGILFPQFAVQSQYGMGFQNLGYYIPVNDRIQTTVYASLYARGTWALNDETSYKVRYKYDGRFNMGFQFFKSPFPSTNNLKKVTVGWIHNQDVKANPFWNFSSNVNFISDNSTKSSLDPLNKDYFQNSVNSDVNVRRMFPGKPVTAGLKMSMRQNSNIHNFTVTSPVLTLNVTRFSPLGWIGKNKPGKKWYQQLSMTYNLEGQNRGSFADSLVPQKRYDLMKQTFLNGVSQNSILQTTWGLFKNTWKLNPSLTYTNKINFQQISKSYDTLTKTTHIDTIRKPGMTQGFSMNAQLTTVLYSYYRFIGKGKPLLRHILTPSFGFRYTPNLTKTISDSVGTNKALITYSPFERSMYPVSAGKSNAVITFGFNNTFELKHRSKKDTVSGITKTRLIDALSFAGSYDLLKDSMNLSDISANLRINPFDFISIVSSANFSPYNWIDSTNAITKDFALDKRGKLARLTNSSINTTYTFTSEKSRKKIRENNELLTKSWTADYQLYALYPERYIDFEIPWKISLGHVFDLARNKNPLTDKRQFSQTQNLTINTDVSISKRWKLISYVYYDIENQKLTNARITLTRNMHCWNLAFYWTPIGGNQSFLFRLNASSSLFQDAKLELKKPPLFSQ